MSRLTPLYHHFIVFYNPQANINPLIIEGGKLWN